MIIAAYNAAQTIEEAISSVLAQTRQDFEVIVIDDGSSDDTATRVARLDDSRVRLHRQANAGPGSARNAGIELARGEYLCMLDSDDLWLPCYLERMAGALEGCADTGFAYTDAWAFEQASGRIRRATAMSRQLPPEHTLPAGEFLEALVQRNFVFNSVAVRREVLKRVGGYDTYLAQAEDYELWLRISASGYTSVRVAGPLAIYRVHADSLSQDEQALLRGLLDAYAAVIDRHPAPANVKLIARERVDAIEGQLKALQSGWTLAGASLRIRRVVAAVTRRARSRRKLLADLPSDVAEAFPRLGDSGA